MQQATVLFCHGSRNVDWRAPFDLLAADVQRRLPGAAGLPGLPGTDVAHRCRRCSRTSAGLGVERVQVVPLFLAPGAHTRRDLPALVAQAREQWPLLQVDVLPTLLESEALRNVLVETLGTAVPPQPAL